MKGYAPSQIISELRRRGSGRSVRAHSLHALKRLDSHRAATRLSAGGPVMSSTILVALNRAGGDPEFILARHEEMAAFDQHCHFGIDTRY